MYLTLRQTVSRETILFQKKKKQENKPHNSEGFMRRVPY